MWFKSRFTIASVVAIGFCLIGVTSASLADEIHVPADFPTIQAAINAAVDGDEVIIADGVYTGAGNQNMNFLGKLITVRSAKGPENCIIEPEPDNYGFLLVSGETSATVLDGLTIRNADSPGIQHLLGSAIVIDGASPVISNCIFEDNLLTTNSGSAFGGAIYSNGNPRLLDCVFENNLADGADTGTGGAFYNDGGAPVLIDCHFQGNRARSAVLGAYGGAIAGVGSITLIRCTFIGNHVIGGFGYQSSSGGAVVIDEALLIDCHFEANDVTDDDSARGGAIIITGESSLVVNCSFFENSLESGDLSEGGAMNGPGTLLNCLFVGNTADRGGGYSGTGSVHNCTFVTNVAGLGAAVDGAAVVSNTIAWSNFGDPFNGAEVTYSNIQGGWPGEGNIDTDPLFVDAANGDYRLSAGSPSIDSGNNIVVACLLEDLDGNERFADGAGGGDDPVVDMGVYEFASPPARGGIDCNVNKLDDACEVAEGIAPDCNSNGVPDECDLAGGVSEDRNGNGVPDECDDCNGNGVFDDEDIANGTSEDCDGNDVPDECDIANGVSDCNDNGILDTCEVLSIFSVASDKLSPLMVDVKLEFLIPMPPEAADDVTMTFVALGDLSSNPEYVEVLLNGVLLGRVFEFNAANCEEDVATLLVAAETFNDLVNGGDSLIRMEPSDSVDLDCARKTFIMVSIDYLRADPDTDANGNGIPDDCELLGDLDGDGVVGPSDLIVLLGMWGSCDDCADCLADLDGDCDVDGADLILLLGNWG